MKYRIYLLCEIQAYFYYSFVIETVYLSRVINDHLELILGTKKVKIFFFFSYSYWLPLKVTQSLEK